MTPEELKEEVINTYMKYYVEGFKKNDISLIDKMIKYPLTYIKDGSATMCESYPINPQKLKDEKGWDHSTDWSFEVTAVNEREAHAIASATRCRKDGSIIEGVHGFYAFTKTNDGWKIYAVADTTFEP